MTTGGPLTFLNPHTSPRSGVVLVSQQPDRLTLLIDPLRFQQILQEGDDATLDMCGALFLAAATCVAHPLGFLYKKLHAGAGDGLTSPGCMALFFEFFTYAAYLAMRESHAWNSADRLRLRSDDPTANSRPIRFWGYACAGLIRELGCRDLTNPLDRDWNGRALRLSFARRLRRYIGGGPRRSRQTLAKCAQAGLAAAGNLSLTPAVEIVPPLLDWFGESVRRMTVGSELSPTILTIPMP